ncbi:hypothetical protein Hdeb2414_s0003g00104881 [Helianthus debilis subsp. tardiflorus]
MVVVPCLIGAACSSSSSQTTVGLFPMLLGFAVSIGALLDKHSNRHSLLVLSYPDLT